MLGNARRLGVPVCGSRPRTELLISSSITAFLLSSNMMPEPRRLVNRKISERGREGIEASDLIRGRQNQTLAKRIVLQPDVNQTRRDRSIHVRNHPGSMSSATSRDDFIG